MKLGVFNTVFLDRSLEEALDAVKSYGLDAIEIGCGGFIPKNHIRYDNKARLRPIFDLNALISWKRECPLW